MPLPSVVELAQLLVARVLGAGASALDATVGNGADTLFLARQVGPSGRVFGFDVQESALETARTHLADAGVLERVELFHAGHEHVRQKIPRTLHGHIAAAMFNLGYLPGGDKRIVTTPDTTLAALAATLDLLAPGGILTVVLYRAHPGGRDEADRVERWAARLPREPFEVYVYQPFNTARDAPRVLAVSKRVPPVPVVPRERPPLA